MSDELDKRFEAMRDLWRSELRRVEHLLDLRLKRLEIAESPPPQTETRRQTTITDEEFMATLETLKGHASIRSDQAMAAGDRRLFRLWDSRLSQLHSITAMDGLRKMFRDKTGENPE